MGEDPARYLAGRLTDLYPVSPVPTEGELLEVCRERGLPVFRLRALGGNGVCVYRPCLGIGLGESAGPAVLPHEIFHAWTWDNSLHGVDYSPPEWEQDDPEAAARRFEALVLTPRQ